MDVLREAIARLLLAAGEGPQAAADEINRTHTWLDGVSLADKWGVLPQLSRRLAALVVDLPSPAHHALRSLTTATFVRSALQARRGVEALAKLEERGIPAVAFKGLASMASLWGGPQSRSIRDVDVLTAERDVQAALSVLASLGFRPVVAGEFADYAAFVRHSPGFSGNAEITLHDGGRCAIDLHWSLGGLTVEPIISRSRILPLLEMPVRVVAPEDGFVLAVHHTLRNVFNPDKSIRDLLDLEASYDLLARDGGLEEAINLAAACGLSLPLLAMTQVLVGFNPCAAAARAVTRVQASVGVEERAAADKLTSLFLLQVREGALNPDLLYLLRPQDLKRILRGLFSGWRRHRDFMQSMETELEGALKPLPMRLGAFFRSLAHTRRRHLGMLRALGRAKSILE